MGSGGGGGLQIWQAVPAMRPMTDTFTAEQDKYVSVWEGWDRRKEWEDEIEIMQSLYFALSLSHAHTQCLFLSAEWTHGTEPPAH